MAGHSKYKNIMHRKGAQDKKRANIIYDNDKTKSTILVLINQSIWHNPFTLKDLKK